MPAIETVMGGNSGPSIASAQAGQTTTQHAVATLLATDSEDVATRIRMLKLPAQHRIVSLCVENEDLDSGATGTVDIGIEDTVQDPADTTDATLFAAAQSVQVAAFNRYESKAIWDLPAVNYDRFIIVDIDVASTTGLAGDVNATLVSRPELGAQFEGNG
jgi:hypothetical protein